MLAAALTALVAALVVGVATGVWPPRRSRPLRRRPRSDWLAQSGLDLKTSQFWAAVVGVGCVVFLLVWAVSGVPVIAVPPALAVAFIPRVIVGRRRSRRLLELQQAWPDGLRDLTASISSGMSLSRALEQLALRGPEPLREALARYPQLARTLGVVPALEIIKGELAHPTSDRIIEVLILAQERGGPIVVDILGDLAAATTRDVWAGEEIETLALEQKINARIVFVVPWVVLLFMTIRPGPFRDFYRSAAGALVVAIGGIASLAGMWWVGRLAADEEEPRLFGGEA
jgi:tight adherence protein B